MNKLIDDFFDTPDELAWGLATGFFSCAYFGWWAIVVGILCAILWRLGGMFGHSKRVFGVPLVISTMFLSIGFSWFIPIYYAMTAITLQQGYGIPSDKPVDEGSALGQYWYLYHNYNADKANLYVRWTVAIMLVLSFLPLAMHVDKIRYDKEVAETNAQRD